MKLTELNQSATTKGKKALSEHFNMSFNVEKLSMFASKSMLQKVRGLIREAKSSPSFYNSHTDKNYMKLVFMEQSLSKHIGVLKEYTLRIVTENEEIEKSQVYLAAQDLVDSVQKMLEDVGQMQVKELPALTSSIESEIGVNESTAYNDAVTQQLDALTATLKESLVGLKGALNGLTGTAAAPDAFDAGAEEMGAPETDIEDGGEFEEPEMPEELPPEEPEEPLSGVGRALR
jgi:hypothetical protein